MEQNFTADEKSNEDKDEQKVEELIGKVSPELLLDLNQSKIYKNTPTPSISEPVKLVIFIGIFDFIVALISNIITGEPHIFIWGSLGIVLALPWGLAFIDGLVFIGYGIYVIKRKCGELDISSSSHGVNEVYEITGETANLLGILYIILGILLLGAVIIRLFIQGIF
jgi:hypothetical protein